MYSDPMRNSSTFGANSSQPRSSGRYATVENVRRDARGSSFGWAATSPITNPFRKRFIHNLRSTIRRWLLCAFTLVALSGAARAQLKISIDGTTDWSVSDVVPLASQVHINFLLPQPPNGQSPVPGLFVHFGARSEVSVDSKLLPSVFDLPYLGSHGQLSRPDGISTVWHYYFSGGMGLTLDLYSWTKDVTTSEGILRAGIPLRDFDARNGTFFIGHDSYNETVARFTIDHYSVTPVPESSAYAAWLSVGLVSLVIVRTRRTRGMTSRAQDAVC